MEGCPRTVQPWLELEKEDGHGGGRAGLLLPVGTTITSILLSSDISEHFNYFIISIIINLITRQRHRDN